MATELSTDLSAASRLEPYLPHLVRSWSEGDEDRAWREVDGTLVSVDISGFTRLSERLAGRGRVGTEELLVLLDACFRGLISIAERYAGDVLKFRGDALLLLYEGVGHPRRACQAAVEMQGFIEGLGRTSTSVGTLNLRMSTGVHSGTCHFFMAGTTHRELVITGPAATETVALEKEARAGQVMVSADTARELEGRWLGAHRNGARLLRRSGMATLPVEPAAGRPVRGGDLLPYLPPAVRQVVESGGGEGEHRHVTAAFVRFLGTDALLAEEGSAAVARRLAVLGEIVDEVTAPLGVVWLETDIARDGGVLYLTAGAPVTTGADAESMLRAVRLIMDARDGLPLAIGVCRGLVFAGDIGGTSRRTYAVMGDPVNLAARLMQRAEPGQVLVAAEVLDRSRTRFGSRPLERFTVKGRRNSVRAHELGAIDRQGADGMASRLPLIGRDRELAALHGAAAAAANGAGRLVELIGEPGLGKSRLVEEVAETAGLAVHVARAEQYESSTPYFAFRPLLRNLAGIPQDATPQMAGPRLLTWVRSIDTRLEAWLPLIALPVGASVASTEEVDRTAESFRRSRFQRAMVRLLGAALPEPTLLVFEDAHWMDEASQDLLRQLAPRVASRPWLVCVTRRAEGSDYASHAGAAGVTLALEPLSADDASALALVAAGDQPIADDTMAALTHRSGGNPLFLRELVASTGGSERLGALPDTVESLITARIDTLRPDDKRLLRAAAVAGAVVDLDVLGEVVDDLDGAADPSRWDRLAEFLEQGDGSVLRFRHDLFRAVAYEGLSYRRRREIHGRLARAIERRAGEVADEQAGLLSLHYLRAEEYGQAWRLSVLAGRRAQAQFANVVAAELYERALEAAARLPELEPGEVASVSESLGDVSELAARYDAAAPAYRRARRLVAGADPLSGARLLQKEGILRERAGRYSDALRWYGRALRLLDAGDGSTAAEARRVRAELEVAYAGVLYRQGRYAESARWGLRAADDAAATAARGTLAHAYYLLDAAYTDLGRPESARYRQLALPIFEEVGDLIGQGNVLNNLGIDAYYEGRWTEAIELYGRSREVKERAGDVVNAAIQSNNEAEVLSDQGRLDEAEERLRRALRVWRAAKYEVGIALATSNLGRVAARAGRFTDASELLDAGLERFEAMGAAGFVLETKARIAECRILEGRTKEADEVLAASFPPNRPVGGVSVLEAFVERLRGWVAQQRRRLPDARAHLERSLEIGRSQGADYEVGVTLAALGQLDELENPATRERAAEARAILDRLGVVALPTVPAVPEKAGTRTS